MQPPWRCERYNAWACKVVNEGLRLTKRCDWLTRTWNQNKPNASGRVVWLLSPLPVLQQSFTVDGSFGQFFFTQPTPTHSSHMPACSRPRQDFSSYECNRLLFLWFVFQEPATERRSCPSLRDRIQLGSEPKSTSTIEAKREGGKKGRRTVWEPSSIAVDEEYYRVMQYNWTRQKEQLCQHITMYGNDVVGCIICACIKVTFLGWLLTTMSMWRR